MYLVREIVNCKPGKVRQMVEKFQIVSTAWQNMGQQPMRLLTDVSGEPFWTVVAEVSVETVEELLTAQQTLMATDESVRNAMAGFHELVANGRREIYRIEPVDER